MTSMVGRRVELSLPVQALALARLVPHGQVRLRPHKLIWHGQVQPTAASGTYDLRLEARRGTTPTVAVTSPALKPNEDGHLPHVYDTGSLCVSRFGDWRPHMLFTDSMLPWACEWLFFYELWLASGLWYGDGPDRLDDVSQARVLHPYR